MTGRASEREEARREKECWGRSRVRETSEAEGKRRRRKKKHSPKSPKSKSRKNEVKKKFVFAPEETIESSSSAHQGSSVERM